MLDYTIITPPPPVVTIATRFIPNNLFLDNTIFLFRRFSDEN